MAQRDQDPLLSTGAAARELGISRFTLLRAVHRDAIRPTQRTPGGYWRFDRAAVQAYAATLAVSSTRTSRRRARTRAGPHDRSAPASGATRHAAEDSVEYLSPLHTPRAGLVTEQGQASAALQRAAARDRALSERAMDIVGILDAEGCISYVSPAVQRLLGYTPAEVCGQNGFTFVHSEDVPRLEQVVAELLTAPGTVVQTVARFRHQDGSWRTFEVINRNELHDPVIQGIIFNERDITERVQAEEALRTSEARHRALSEHATDLVAIMGVDGTYRYLSPSWERVLGYAPATLLGRDGFALLHPDDMASVQAALAPCVWRRARSLPRCSGSTMPTAAGARWRRSPPIAWTIRRCRAS